ncbi:hypothetical protein HYY75_07325, partial [bacterium]|nr:hypothetical protein [bacterium]
MTTAFLGKPQETRNDSENLSTVSFRLVFLVFVFSALLCFSQFLSGRSSNLFPLPKFSFRGNAFFDVGSVKNPTLVAFAISPKGKIAILDSKSGVSQVFSSDGRLLFQTPEELPGAGKLLRPLSIAFGEQEEIFVADTGNQRVVQFASNGAIKTLGKPGIFNGQFVLPTSLLISEGNLFVLDSSLCRIQEFNSSGF